MERTKVNLKDKESSASGDSDKGFCTEAPQIGAAGQDPVEQGAGETPLIGEERPPPSSLSPENLEGLTEKVGTLGLQVTSKNRCGAAKKRTRRARLAEASSGDSGGASLSLLQAVSHKLCRSSVYPGSNKENLRRVKGTHLTKASDSGRPGELPRGEGRG